MTIQEQIAAIEAAVRGADKGIHDLCRRAGISRATWQRWKAGKTSPTLQNWRSVEEAARAIQEGR